MRCSLTNLLSLTKISQSHTAHGGNKGTTVNLAQLFKVSSTIPFKNSLQWGFATRLEHP